MSCWLVVLVVAVVRVLAGTCGYLRVLHKKGAAPGGTAPDMVLATQTEALDQAPVARDVLGLEVLQQPAALADEQEQATT